MFRCRFAFVRVLLTAVIPAALAALPCPAAPRVESFDADWRFHRGATEGAENAEFDDADWRRLDVPHDRSIEGGYDRGAAVGRGGSYRPAGVGWHRKHFTLPAEDEGGRVFVEFDGVMAHSDVWINGQRPCSTDFDDVVHVEFEIVYAEGARCPWSDARVRFEVAGPGQRVAVDNGDPQSHESFQGPQRRAFHGLGLAITRRTAGDGAMTLTASAGNLESASVVIQPAPCTEKQLRAF
jgi:hypothetical protein